MYTQVPDVSGVPHGQEAAGMHPTGLALTEPPKYEYTPSDFLILSMLTAVLCGLFSPCTLLVSIPAVMFSLQSKRKTKLGQMNSARRHGLCAAYLSVAAITTALVVACLAAGLTLGLYTAPT